VSRHRLFAEDAATLLANGLDHRQSRIRVLTCDSLADLGHAAAVPVLLGALQDEDTLVRSSAHAALERLTGVELEADPEAWNAWWQALG
jgi:HEAT repeat protein